MIYNKYYSNISEGVIDINNVNYNVHIVTTDYEPKEDDTEATNIIETIESVITGSDITTLTMSEIIDKVKSFSKEENLTDTGMVVFDNLSGDFCFYERI